MSLPPFPVDEETLSLVWSAINPDWAIAERSSLFDLCDMYSRMAGSDPNAVSEVVEDGIYVMRDVLYTDHDIIVSLIDEVRRLRADPDA